MPQMPFKNIKIPVWSKATCRFDGGWYLPKIGGIMLSFQGHFDNLYRLDRLPFSKIARSSLALSALIKHR